MWPRLGFEPVTSRIRAGFITILHNQLGECSQEICVHLNRKRGHSTCCTGVVTEGLTAHKLMGNKLSGLVSRLMCRSLLQDTDS
jgi:hypothetical protein